MHETRDNLIKSLLIFFISFIFLLFILEFVLVLKNKNGKNYDIEMWKYSRYLKQKSANPILGQEHIVNKSAVLQNVEISINSLGMRGNEPDLSLDKILFLGSSITLGWGVKEANTFPALVAKEFKDKYCVLNAGISNYNSLREIEVFFTKYKDLSPKIIVISYFVNDAEILKSTKSNWLLKNSQLALLIWSRIQHLQRLLGFKKAYSDYYRDIYADDYQGWIDTQNAFRRLSEHSRNNDTKVLVTMIPDIHNLNNYPFGFIHEKIQKLSLKSSFSYIDFYDSFRAIDEKELWAMEGDPHPNSYGHKLMARQVIQALQKMI